MAPGKKRGGVGSRRKRQHEGRRAGGEGSSRGVRAGLPSEEAVLSLLRSSRKGPLKAKELARELGVPGELYRDFRSLLRTLEHAGKIYRVKGQRYAVPDKINLVAGRLSVIRSGDGFVVPKEGKESQDVFVPMSALGSAMDGDQVVARVEEHPRGRNPVGRVIKVLERAHPTAVGTYHRARNFGFVVPRDRRMTRDILISQGDEAGARDEDVVLVRIVQFGDGKLNPVGHVDEVLGPITETGVDVLAILYSHGLPQDFPDEVEEAAAGVVAEGPKPTEQGRLDRRALPVFTVDPADARDHDDALSIEPAGDGVWEVGIHIADVSWFVTKGGVLDAEALSRGTSVYLVDRVVPMLPHVLSSNACSLVPGADRAAVSVFATVDMEGRLRSHRFERTWVRSRHKLSYEQVQEVLDGVTGIDPETDEALRRLNELARVLRRRRSEHGSLDFDLPEARVVLGSEGEPVEIQKILRLESHLLIEDFMLLANEIVATEGSARKLPVLYRVHEPPVPQKLEALREFLASLGHAVPRRPIRPPDLQKVLERVRGRPEENLVSTVVLRSMQRARYSTWRRARFGSSSPT